jgi:hypothetical protein
MPLGKKISSIPNDIWEKSAVLLMTLGENQQYY